ncbi:MAG: putative integral rane protein [Chloroflexota bacterium]|jgi:hypothetical protein|nr:putative integral rane protein [Chloroflexota bacterium]
MSLFPFLLGAHICLALLLFVPSLLLPFTLRLDRERIDTTGVQRPRAITRGLLWLGGSGGVIVGIGVAVTGLSLVALIGSSLLSQPWLLVALGLYAVNLALAFFIQRPSVRRLLRIRPTDGEDDRQRWRDRAARLRYVSYVMGLVVGVIGFLMVAKPDL